MDQEQQERPAPPGPRLGEQLPLGEQLRIDERTMLVVGQVLDMGARQPDIANALVHRTGHTVVVVDTGATTAFRDAIKAAVDAVDPERDADNLLLLTTHGHTDHVGNNDLIDELASERGITAEHFVPARDVDQMVDPVAYWSHAFEGVDGLTAMPAPPHLSAAFVVSLFEPLHPFGATTRLYEELPMRRLDLGPISTNGWSFADGAVSVLRSQGHCAGHVVVYLRDSRVLHLGDEDNGPCAVMADADQVKLQATLALAAGLVRSGDVDAVTDGHSFTVRRGRDAQDHLDAFLDHARALQELARRAPGDQDPIDGADFAGRLLDRLTELTGSAPASAVFSAMMAVNELADGGFRRRRDGHWERKALIDPEPVSAKPHGLAVIPAAVEMAGWKLRRKDR